jgi:Extended Signal Peptide of Type V secretion system
MNKVYRIVRSKIDGRLIVASEIARGAVKGKGTGMLTMTALLLLSGAHAAEIGQIVPIVPTSPALNASVVTGTTYSNAVANSITKSWVNIKAPNPEGISHNQYNKFNVTSGTPAIINNVTSNLARTIDHSWYSGR